MISVYTIPFFQLFNHVMTTNWDLRVFILFIKIINTVHKTLDVNNHVSDNVRTLKFFFLLFNFIDFIVATLGIYFTGRHLFDIGEINIYLTLKGYNFGYMHIFDFLSTDMINGAIRYKSRTFFFTVFSWCIYSCTISKPSGW